MSQYEVMFAGFGGQGILTAGQLLAYAGISENKQVVWLPSYGPEMRGGTAYCTVVISDSRIGSPIIDNPQALCAFNRPSYDKFMPKIKPGGVVVVNTSLIDVTTDRVDITELLIPANEIATKAGNAKATNIAILGALIFASKVIQLETAEVVIKDKLAKKKEILDVNLTALKEGYQMAQKLLKQTSKKAKA